MFLFGSLVLIKWNINHIIYDREPPCSVAREGPGLPRYMAHTVRTATKKSTHSYPTPQNQHVYVSVKFKAHTLRPRLFPQHLMQLGKLS